MRSHEIALPVIVPERTAIIPSRFFHHAMQRFPWPGGIGCRAHKVTFLRRAEIDPKPSSVKTNCTRPDAAAVALHAIPIHLRSDLLEIINDVPQDAPVHEIPGL